jgi:hypothetical protein
MPQHYKDLIFSTHALQRQKDRSISLEAIYQTLHRPEQLLQQEAKEIKKYTRHIAGRHYQVIAKYLPAEKKHLIVSVWVRGEEDRLPFIWQLLSAPFRFVWWFLKFLWQVLSKKHLAK